MTRSPPVPPLLQRRVSRDARNLPTVIPAKAGIHPRADRAALPNHPHDPLTPSSAACFSGAYRGTHATSPPSFPRRRESIPEQTAPYCPITHTTRSPLPSIPAESIPEQIAPSAAIHPRADRAVLPHHPHARMRARDARNLPTVIPAKAGIHPRADRAVLPNHPHDPLTRVAPLASAARIEGRAQGNRASPDPRPKQGGHDPRRRSELWTKPHGCATVSSGEGAGGWPRPALGRTSWIGGVPFSAQNVTPARYQRHRTAQNDTV